MKTKLFKYSIVLLSTGFFLACSTKKDKWANRNFQALNTKYNVLYNGNIALDKGIEELRTQYQDNFWEVLPIERMLLSKEDQKPGDVIKNANFERAEDKAVKAIQKRSMNIGGKERNPQMDEAHLLLGKARYYDQRFIPALEAFNYVLYKYPESDKIYEVKIWREKTNMRLEYNTLAITNLTKLLKEIKVKDQIFADANATIAQAYFKEEQLDSAIAKLKIAKEFTKIHEEKARYQFILGQLFEKTNQSDSAFVAYQQVIDMKRKSPRQYTIQAIGRQTLQFDPSKGDTLQFNKKYKNLLEDRENRPYLAQLNHQLALHYDKHDDKIRAVKYYNASLRQETQDYYLKASNYRNLAIINFDKAQYLNAGKYYDSTMTFMDPTIREFKNIKKKRENLEDVIKYEGIAKTNDSILSVVAMSEEGKKSYYADYIAKIKVEDEKREKLEKKKQEIAQRSKNSGDSDRADFSKQDSRNSQLNPSTSGGLFYFYNPSTVAYGKAEFEKKWGKRARTENWRWKNSSKAASKVDDDESIAENDESNIKSPSSIENPRYQTDFYISQLPTKQSYIDTLKTDRNFAYYQLGVIYKEKFMEYQLAAYKLEDLLENQPEERLILPTYYNLFKIYEIINPAKAQNMKSRLIAEYPTSRYAQLIQAENSDFATANSPEKSFANLYGLYENGAIIEAYELTVKAVDEFTGDEMAPKFELLKAKITGRLKGVAEYKKALNYVALTYPNSLEGKEAESLLKKNIPQLEKYKFDVEKPTSYKVIFPTTDLNSTASKNLIAKITQFVKERTIQKLSISQDIYTLESYFIVIHGIPTEEEAKEIMVILKEYKDYKISDPYSIISSENYKVVQAHKNYDQYLLPREIPTSYPGIQYDVPSEVKQPVKKEEQKGKPATNRETKRNNTNAVPAPPKGDDEPERGSKPKGDIEQRKKELLEQRNQNKKR